MINSYFSRKYPIQLIIKNISANPETLQDEAKPTSKSDNEPSPTKDRTNDSNAMSNLTHQSSSESVTATDDKSVNTHFHDLGSTILLSDVSVP